MTQEELHKQLEDLVQLPKECEWAEFKSEELLMAAEPEEKYNPIKK